MLLQINKNYHSLISVWDDKKQDWQGVTLLLKRSILRYVFEPYDFVMLPFVIVFTINFVIVIVRLRDSFYTTAIVINKPVRVVLPVLSEYNIRKF